MRALVAGADMGSLGQTEMPLPVNVKFGCSPATGNHRINFNDGNMPSLNQVTSQKALP